MYTCWLCCHRRTQKLTNLNPLFIFTIFMYIKTYKNTLPPLRLEPGARLMPLAPPCLTSELDDTCTHPRLYTIYYSSYISYTH